MNWIIVLLCAAASCGLAYGDCRSESSFRESDRVLEYINDQRAHLNLSSLIWDADLADYAADLVRSCKWVHPKWPHLDCNEYQVGIILLYMRGSNRNLDYFLNFIWVESKKAFDSANDEDSVGRSYAMLSNGEASRIGCDIGNCPYGFCAVDVYTPYRI